MGTPRTIGRPRRVSASAHEAIMDAVYALLKERSVRQLSMDEVARQAGVGKPTLYKWWPSKAALVFAMFHERLAQPSLADPTATVEAFMRLRVRRLIDEFHDLFGKVIAELIGEGQSDPEILQDLVDRHIGDRRAHAAAQVRRGILSGEFEADIDPELLVDQIFGPIYYRMLLRLTPLDHAYGEALVDLVMAGARKRTTD